MQIPHIKTRASLKWLKAGYQEAYLHNSENALPFDDEITVE